MINKQNDDYEWNSEYPSFHDWQTRDILSRREQFYLKNYDIVNDEVRNANLHENQSLLYNFCLKNKPESIFEVGFGYANHLVNIRKLLGDNVKIGGCDISSTQLTNAKKYCDLTSYNLDLNIYDFSNYEVKDGNSYELVYSNAVLMHMSTKRAKAAIENMVKLSSKYVLIIDGKLPISDAEEFCSQFGSVYVYEEFWSMWQENNAVPMLITKENV